MNGERGISDELRPYVDSGEIEGIDRVGERLDAERPIPRAAFRAELQGRLASMPSPWRPQRLGLAVAAYAGSGFLLMALAAIGLAGAGPLGN
jgi:hypothetical protein